MNSIHYSLASMMYAVVFAGLSIMFISSDFRPKRHAMFIIAAIISYTLMNLGNFIYALGISDPGIKLIWKLLAPYFVFFFIYSGVEDRKFTPKIGRMEIPVTIISWIMGIVVFMPTFRANLKLATLWPFS